MLEPKGGAALSCTAGTIVPSRMTSGSACTTCNRLVEAIVSANCRPTWAISDTGRNAEIEINTNSGSNVGREPALLHQHRANTGDREATQTRRDFQWRWSGNSGRRAIVTASPDKRAPRP